MRRRLLPVAAALLVALMVPAATAPAHPGHGATPVDIGAFAFSPSTVNVTAGDVVFWRWSGADRNHSVTKRSGSGPSFDSDPKSQPGQVPAHPANDGFGEQFTEPGTYTYVCKNHDFMQGTINVAPDTTAGGQPPVDNVSPQLLGVRFTPTRMCPRRSRRCSAAGGRLRFTLSEQADLEGRIYRVRGKRRTFKRFLDFSGKPGGNDRRFSVAGLSPGTYQLTLVAFDDADNASALARRNFVVRAS